MIAHLELGNTGFQRMRKLKCLIDRGEIQFAGNKKLKIYGTFCCSSGKRMKAESRVFFQSEEDDGNNLKSNRRSLLRIDQVKLQFIFGC